MPPMGLGTKFSFSYKFCEKHYCIVLSTNMAALIKWLQTKNTCD